MGNFITRSCRNALGIPFLLFCFSGTPVFADSHGLVGEKIADFSASVTTVSYLEDRNVLNLQSDSDIGKFGTVGVSATFMHPIDEKGSVGQYSALGVAFRPDGTLLEFTSQGAWKSLGGHRWEVKTIGLDTEGSRTYAVGVVELKTMSFKGSVYSLD